MSENKSRNETQRKPASAYFPNYVEDDAELDYCYAKCRCGWESEAKSHPDSADYQRDIHIEHGDSPDCSLPEIELVFADGTGATIA